MDRFALLRPRCRPAEHSYLAGYLGVDVRFLCQFHPDKWIPFFAGRYYFGEVLRAGVKIYQYTKGMMHSKVVLVDGQWASVGTANLDNRSLHSISK